MDTTWNQASEEQKQNWKHFFRLMPLIIQIAGGEQTLAAVLAQFSGAICVSIDVGKEAIFPTVVYIKCQFNKVKYGPDILAEHIMTYNLVRAQTCQHGSCK